MKQETFIFMGRSGCGKGTQAEMLMKKLKEADPGRGIVYIQTGAELRHFIEGSSYTQKITKPLYEEGDLMPEFLTVFQWVKVLIERFTGSEHLIFDGTPRKVHEAGVLNSIFDFYKLGIPKVIYIDIGKDTAKERLLARKRLDDTESDIAERLSWFETDVVPAIDFYRNNPKYRFLEINGERGMEEIHSDLMRKIADVDLRTQVGTSEFQK